MRMNARLITAIGFVILTLLSFAQNLNAMPTSAKIVRAQKFNDKITHLLDAFGRCLAKANKGDNQPGEQVCHAVVNFPEEGFHDVGECLAGEPKFSIQGHGVDKSHNRARYFLEVLCNGSRIGVGITGDAKLLRVESVSEIIP